MRVSARVTASGGVRVKVRVRVMGRVKVTGRLKARVRYGLGSCSRSGSGTCSG